MEIMAQSILPQLLDKHQAQLMKDWLAAQKVAGIAVNTVGDERFKRFIDVLKEGAVRGQFEDITTSEWVATREILAEISRERALKGSTPTETAMFVFSLKEP